MACSEKNLIEEKIKDLTDCPICLDAFRDPKILPCIHTFCVNCLREAWEKLNKNPKDTMPCPVCRREFAVPDTGFGGLQKNFFMEKLTEMRQILKPSSSIILCDPCLDEREPNAEADIPSAEVYCLDCHQKLCPECYRHHRKNKVSKTHNIIALDGEQIIKLENMQKAFSVHSCEKHDRILENYCSDCQVVVCTKCVNERHKLHDWMDASKSASDFRNEIKTGDGYRCLSSGLPDLEQERDYLETYKTEIVLSLEKIQSNVNSRRQELKDLVDNHSDSILAELDKIRMESLKKCETRRENIETLLVSLKGFTTYCSQIAEFGSDIDICRAKSDLDARLRELRELYDSSGKSSYQLSYVSFKFTDLEDYWRRPQQNIIGKLKCKYIFLPCFLSLQHIRIYIWYNFLILLL